jgi:hypothetical protein
MPIDVQSELIAIATITIIGCAFIGHLAIYAGCQNPLIVLWLITAIATLLFFTIHLIERVSMHGGLFSWECHQVSVRMYNKFFNTRNILFLLFVYLAG